ncbi:hypothetical protein E8E13_000302 [Curvularia kusanoi]|uniref:Uncharacterized protein n=1 Tax=Curvularia kusanoi TaxID=90978 RepID=A0A9P4T546_CURKU|nr:hypothetical protein E8E13_000302 [Curvularia kusanoi]
MSTPAPPPPYQRPPTLNPRFSEPQQQNIEQLQDENAVLIEAIASQQVLIKSLLQLIESQVKLAKQLSDRLVEHETFEPVLQQRGILATVAIKIASAAMNIFKKLTGGSKHHYDNHDDDCSSDINKDDH